MKLIITFLLFSLLFLSCNKEDNPPIEPPDGDTISFSIPVTEDIVMYEVNLRALSQEGDINGVLNRLDEIKELGINVIWLMPIHPIGDINSVNSPYSVKDYKAVNPEFGTLDDLKKLVREAHKLDIAIILDWVANHTSWDNPWITNVDWYTKDGQGNIVHPPGTNWLDVADLDYSSQAMRLAMIDAMEYWITAADIDGFRCDAADMVPFDFWRQAIDSVSGLKDSLIWLAEGARTDHFAAGFQMNYSWNFYNGLKNVMAGNQSAASLISIHNQEYSTIPDGKYKLRFTTNHDESAWDATPMVLFNGEKGALAASVAAIYLGGVPMIYGSQEVGVEQNVPFFTNAPIDWSLHPEMLEAYKALINYYNDSEPFKVGTLVSFSGTDILAFTRTSGQHTALVIVNMRNRPVTYSLDDQLQNFIWIDAFDGSAVTLTGTIDLAAYEYMIFKNQ